MLLHRYFASHANETLRDKRLLVTAPSGFNDPFESLYHHTGNWGIAQVKKIIKGRSNGHIRQALYLGEHLVFSDQITVDTWVRQHIDRLANRMIKYGFTIPEANHDQTHGILDNVWRVCSFSEADLDPFDEILLWSHYSAKHQGVRLHFEFPDQIVESFPIERLQYSEELTGMDLSVFQDKEKVDSAIKKAIRTKCRSWSYEREWRIIAGVNKCHKELTPDGAKWFLPFDHEWVTGIDFGVRCPVEIQNEIVAIRDSNYPNAVLRKACLHKKKYQLTYHKI